MPRCRLPCLTMPFSSSAIATMPAVVDVMVFRAAAERASFMGTCWMSFWRFSRMAVCVFSISATVSPIFPDSSPALAPMAGWAASAGTSMDSSCSCCISSCRDSETSLALFRSCSVCCNSSSSAARSNTLFFWMPAMGGVLAFLLGGWWRAGHLGSFCLLLKMDFLWDAVNTKVCFLQI